MKGKIQKYTEYSDKTGITKDKGQSIMMIIKEYRADKNQEDVFGGYIPVMAEMAYEFAVERDWVKYDKPSNLLLAMLSEVGELGELYQWKEGQSEISQKLSDKTGQELADVAIYLMRFAKSCGVEIVIGEKN